MLVIIEKDEQLRKKLCDLLERERILGVGSITEAVEKICQFRNKIKLIISRIHFLPDINSKQLISKICAKLSLKTTPVVGYYTKDDLAIKGELEKIGAKFELVEYNEADPEFPEKYIKIISAVYPDLICDTNRAKELWLKKSKEQVEEFVDPRKWLEEEGFVDIVEKMEGEEKDKSLDEVIPVIEKMLKESLVKEESVEEKEVEADYKKLYLAMKEKYEQLSSYVKELIDFVKGV